MSDKNRVNKPDQEEEQAPPEILRNGAQPQPFAGLRGGGMGGGRGGGGGPGGPVGMGDLRKPKDLKGTLLKIAALISDQKLWLAAIALFTILSTLCTTLAPYMLGIATNEVVDGANRIAQGTGGIDFGALGRILLTMIVIYVFSNAFSYFQSVMSATLTQRVMYAVRGQIDRKIRKLPLKFFDSQTLGEILSRVTNDVDTMSMTLQQYLPQVFSSVLTLIMVLVAMLSLSPFLTLLGVITMPLSALFTAFVMKKSQRYYRGQQRSLGEIAGYVEEMYAGHTVNKAFSREEEVCDAFEKINDRLYNNSWRSQFISGLMMPASQFFSNSGYMLVAVFGGLAAISGQVPIGTIQSQIQYLRQFSQPINHLTTMTNLLQSTIAAAERVFHLLEEEEELADPPNPVSLEEPRGDIDISHLKFGYSPDKILMRDLSINLNSGDKIAIVGPTGAGKTTLVNLLLRFYDIQGGRISIDGVDIMDMRRADLRSLFGMVLQDTWLFSGTIMENIRYGRLDASDDEVRAAARAAYADLFIRTLPGGYDMILGEDASNISQGQRQLLTIARAILSDPVILILDEATSSVDTRTEVLIQKAMIRLMENRTSFVIAHRLSTIRDAQMILVIDNGDIVETGTHQQLLDKQGFYHSLYYSQFLAANE